MLFVSSVLCSPFSEGVTGVRPVCLGHLGLLALSFSPEDVAFCCEDEQASLDPGEASSLEQHATEPEDERHHL